MNETADEHRAA